MLALGLASLSALSRAASIVVKVVDPVTGRAVASDITVEIEGKSLTLEAKNGFAVLNSPGLSGKLRTLNISAGTTKTIWLTSQQQDERPPKEITIRIVAKRNVHQAAATGGSQQIDKATKGKFTNTNANDSKEYTKGAAGVADDSAGQQHVRGEHTDLTYVVDGVPLPDTLSGKQGSIVVPSTIQNFEILTGAFAPEFGGQTAAVFNITTLPNQRNSKSEFDIEAGSYQTRSGAVTLQGPIGAKCSYVLNISSDRTNAALEPHQPDHLDTHNAGSNQSIFAKMRTFTSSDSSLTLTVSRSPDSLEIANRTGLGPTFASVGQGYGFLGLRNADGSRPDANGSSALGAGNLLLPNQQDAGVDIYQHEVNEFATLDYKRRWGAASQAQVAITLLHSGQFVENRNPLVNLANLPVDSSIEYNPISQRNVHHVQFVGSFTRETRGHQLKSGFTWDEQSGRENYQIIPASQLALDALAALSPSLAPAGFNSGVTDINGNPVYTLTSLTSPTLFVNRKGSYRAAFAQDTWKLGRLTSNYGVRFDSYRQSQDLGQGAVNSSLLSPRLNFAYQASGRTQLRASYDKIFNTPPLAQGAIVGQQITPELVDQYDLGMSQDLGHRQAINLAYYYKKIKNQVDVGLLIPGSDVGLYSGVSFDQGAVHGIEFSYNQDAPKTGGFDYYFNLSYSAAKPNGKDNTGADVPDYNDHDQRITIGTGLAYSWRDGTSAAFTVQHGSGLSSSIVDPTTNKRTPRTEVDFRLASSDKLLGGHGSLSLDVTNLFDQRTVINFQSAFSGTRFMPGRRIALSANLKY